MNTEAENRTTCIVDKIKEIVCDLSGLETEDVVGDISFLELGFDSLFMTQLAGAFQKEFELSITFRKLINELGSINKLTEFLDANLADNLYQNISTEQETIENPPSQALGAELSLGSIEILESASTLSSIDPEKGTLHAVMAEQLKLMSHQLKMLNGGSIELPNQDKKQGFPSTPTDSETASKPAEASKEAVNSAHNEEIKLPPGFVPQVDEQARSKQLDDQHQAHLSQLIVDYNKRTKTSKQLTQQYRSAHADPRTAAGFNPLWKELVYPIVIERSSGSHLWDVDGNEYIDLLNGFGPNFLGHSRDFVTSALHEQLDKGIEIGPQTPLAGEVAEMICEFTGMDRATFVNTGSEAVQGVMRVARTVTGKDKIVIFDKDYHGNFDEVLVRGVNSKKGSKTLPLAPGIPRNSVDNIIVLEYGTDSSLELIEQHAEQIAAVLIEPMQSRRPEFKPKAFIKKLRQLTEDKEIIFIFDEVITGFRTSLGGAQEYYGVKADLATYGKVIGGGMPIGIVAGKARYMDTFDGGHWQYEDESYPSAGVTFFAGTFVRHPLAIAAAHATLTFLREQGPEIYENIYAKTTRLATTLNRLFENNGIDIHVAHFSSQMYFRITDENELINLLFYHARLNGLYMLEGFPSYLTLSHTDEDIDKVIAIFAASIAKLQQGGIISIPEGRSQQAFDLSTGQSDIWIASQLSEAASCAYNESDTVRLQGNLDVSKLQAAVRMILSRHQSFNLRIDNEGQKQFADWQFKHEVPLIDLSQLADEGISQSVENFYEEQASTPFDLEKGPLVRVHILKLTSQMHLLVIYGHHIAFDGWSSSLALHEIAQLYSGLVECEDITLPPAMGFNTYVAEQNNMKQSEATLNDVSYWNSLYQDGIPVHQLPLDIARPPSRSFQGGTVHHEYEHELLIDIRQAAVKAGVTVQNYLLAGFIGLLHKLSGEKDMVVGIPTAGQMLASNNCLAGYCVNLLPMRQSLDVETKLQNYLNEVKNNVLDIFEHQHCSFSELLRTLPISRDSERLPLVEVVFNYSSYFDELNMSGLETAVYENARRAVNFDMFLNIVEMEDCLHVDWDYSAELFFDETVQNWAEMLGQVYREMISSPDSKLTQVFALARK